MDDLHTKYAACMFPNDAEKRAALVAALDAGTVVKTEAEMRGYIREYRLECLADWGPHRRDRSDEQYEEI